MSYGKANHTPDEAADTFVSVLRAMGTNGAAESTTLPHTGPDADTGEDSHHSSDSDGDVRRRDFLRSAAVSVAGAPGVAPVLDALVSLRQPPATVLSVQQLSRKVATVKHDYQACRYERVLDQLVTLLPALEPATVDAESGHQMQVNVLAAELYHVVGSVLLKLGDRGMALIAAERSTRAAATSQDPVAVAASARIMTHALMSNHHDDQAVTLAADAAGVLDRDTRLASTDAVAVYGSLVLRGAVAAARRDDRDTAHTMLDEATRAATRLGYDGNDRWTGFGATNVLLHRVNIALTLGDAGTAIDIARTVPLEKVTLAERKATLHVDVARAYTQWGRHEQGLNALRTAYEVAPEEIRCRPAVHRLTNDLTRLTTGPIRAAVVNFTQTAGIPQ
ncbi:hypothetical protein [Micromonospora sp. NBC_00421]|uniref:hypothetical protein n=1 Tax=Micromonospora sp. NBC_00421 TaxID=2975976 RepID=UPI002E23F8BC